MVAVGVTLAAGVIPMVTAGSASAASGAGCRAYLAAKNYDVGPKAKKACSYPAIDLGLTKIESPSCVRRLVAIRVKYDDAKQACLRA
ncbi:hypothetical protein GCM10010245_69720 [Streptomyces spectabilis]|nr:hypothetical protein GCM10010245_69720 [Streptomyces spectabilis]